MIAVTNSNWRQGRQLLRQYLQVKTPPPASYHLALAILLELLVSPCTPVSQEIGYTDTIIDVRSNRVRSLLGLQADQDNETNQVSPQALEILYVDLKITYSNWCRIWPTEQRRREEFLTTGGGGRAREALGRPGKMAGCFY